jgi:hypothetical protein
MSNLHYNQWEVGWLFEAIVNPPLEVPLPRYEKIHMILYGQSLNKKHYEVIIGNFLACICLDFVAMMSSLLGRWGKWAPCKHVLCFATCHVLWAIQKFHPFSNSELWWSLSFVNSWCNYSCVGRSTLLNCYIKKIQWTLSILTLVMMLCV